jgi:hypothetical protein
MRPPMNDNSDEVSRTSKVQTQRISGATSQTLAKHCFHHATVVKLRHNSEIVLKTIILRARGVILTEFMDVPHWGEKGAEVQCVRKTTIC